MQNQIRHYRVEFYGGPNDGSVQYSREIPDEIFKVVTKSFNTLTREPEIFIYEYVLNWLNEYQAKYYYKDSYSIKAE